MSRRPTATILKLIKGDEHKERHRDDAPKNPGMPVIPPGCVLSADELAMWDHLMAETFIPGVHGTGDGAAFVEVARLWARVNAVDAKIASHGLVMKSPQGKPELNPYTRLSRDLWQQIRLALSEVGGTPVGRQRMAGPRGAAAARDATSWDAID